MAATVSAIITTHNRLSLLPRAIDSVLSQTYPNIECIVVSDNSIDGTVEYCKNRPDIHFIEIPASESRGGNYARNIGIKASKGEYVAFLDDDDYWLPNKIEEQLHLAEKTGFDVVFCPRHFEIIGSDGNIEGERDEKVSDNGDYHKKVLLTCCVTTSSSMLIKKDLLTKAGMFDERLLYWQDYELTIRLAQLSQFGCVKEPLTVYRINKYDTYRLSNKYYDWWDSVNYIHKKHKQLYSSLSFTEKRMVRVITLRDALCRADTAGLKREIFRVNLAIKFWAFPEILKDKLISFRDGRK